MTAIAKYLLMVLAVLAVGSSQVLGVVRGYLCECHGVAVITEETACEALECSHGGEHSEENGDGSQQPGEHQQITEALVGIAFGPLTIDVPPPAAVDLPEGIAPGIQLASELEGLRAELRPPEDTGPVLSAAVAVARTTVMLV